MRKLMILALGGAAAAYVIRNRSQQAAPASGPSATDFAPGPEAAAEHPVTETVSPGTEEHQAEAAAVDVTADTVESEAVTPDTSADDPLVREQENAAAAQAASIGGEADTVTADEDPAMRPVNEGSGDAEETFEATEDQGR